MRLHLRIERNALPPVLAIWPITDPKSTVAQFLDAVNEIFPLEADTWGLEDYRISINNFELVHYHELNAVCKDEDEIVIKPLQYEEVRSRTLTGRDQIAPDGRHLVDGIPFGRPCLRSPTRPRIRIPPRKKRKLHTGDGDGDGNYQATDPTVSLMFMEKGKGLDSDSDDDSEYYETEEDTSDTAFEDEETDDEDNNADDRSVRDNSISDDNSHTASWEGLPPTPRHKSSSLPDKVPNQPPANMKQRRQKLSVDNKADASSAGKVVSKALPYGGSNRTKARNHRRRDARKLRLLKEQRLVPPNTTLNELRAWPEINPLSQMPKTNQNNEEHIPGPVHERNSIYEKLQREPEEKLQASTVAITRGDKTSSKTLGGASVEPRAEQTQGEVAVLKKRTAESPNANAEEKRQKLIEAIASGGIDVTEKPSRALQSDREDDQPPQELSSKENPSAPGFGPTQTEDAVQQNTFSKGAAMIPLSVIRRSKLDLAGSQRLVLGSLGVRVPKTQEEREQLQRRLAERPKKNITRLDQNGLAATESDMNGVPASSKASTAVGDREDSGTWQSKIHLTAVECSEEGVELSTPPFPFYQRWDPQQQRKKTSQRTSDIYTDTTSSGQKRKRGKRGKRSAQYLKETYDKYNTAGYGDALNYDDEENWEDDSYWEDDALLDGSCGEAYETSNKAKDDFPALPSNLDELHSLKEENAHLGDFITFCELACESSTDWQPKMVTRTAKIVEAPSSTAGEAVSSGSWCFQLAPRDRKTVEYDDDGNRVYGKFEMPDEDADDLEGKRAFVWNELGDVKLLQHAQKGT